MKRLQTTLAARLKLKSVPVSASANKNPVESTHHQLVAVESTAYGLVANIRSLPVLKRTIALLLLTRYSALSHFLSRTTFRYMVGYICVARSVFPVVIPISHWMNSARFPQLKQAALAFKLHYTLVMLGVEQISGKTVRKAGSEWIGREPLREKAVLKKLCAVCNSQNRARGRRGPRLRILAIFKQLPT